MDFVVWIFLICLKRVKTGTKGRKVLQRTKWRTTRHASVITRHTSDITRHASDITRHYYISIRHHQTPPHMLLTQKDTTRPEMLVHHLWCIISGAYTLVHHLRCITSGASPLVHHFSCITTVASPLLHHLWCISSGVSPLVYLLWCITSCELTSMMHQWFIHHHHICNPWVISFSKI